MSHQKSCCSVFTLPSSPLTLDRARPIILHEWAQGAYLLAVVNYCFEAAQIFLSDKLKK